MHVREHKNSNETVLVTLSTKKDCNNISVNLLMKEDEYQQFKTIDTEAIDNSFVENLHSKFGYSVSVNALQENLIQYNLR